MNRPEAYALFSAALEGLRGQGFSSLKAQVGSAQIRDILAPSGVRYSLEIALHWSDSHQHTILIKGRIDDSSNCHFAPLEEKFSLSA